jgi:hypothetical protein
MEEMVSCSNSNYCLPNIFRWCIIYILEIVGGLDAINSLVRVHG